MRRCTVFLVAVCASSAACGFLGEEGSGVLVTRSIDVGADIRAVEVGDAFLATISVGAAAPSASTTIDDNLVDHLAIEVDDDVLRVELSGRVRNATLGLEVALPALTSLEASGASRVEVEGGLDGEVEIGASGASTVHVDAVELEAFRLDVSGASRVETDGTAASIEADVSGASELDFAGVEAEVVVVNVSGASTVDVTVTEQLDAEASGASTVRYRGDPDVRVDASGSSSVERA
jgi:hypothetical protein